MRTLWVALIATILTIGFFHIADENGPNDPYDNQPAPSHTITQTDERK